MSARNNSRNIQRCFTSDLILQLIAAAVLFIALTSMYVASSVHVPSDLSSVAFATVVEGTSPKKLKKIERSCRSDRHEHHFDGLSLHPYFYGQPTLPDPANNPGDKISIMTIMTLNKFDILLEVVERWQRGFTSVAVVLKGSDEIASLNALRLQYLDVLGPKVDFHVAIADETFNSTISLNVLRNLALRHCMTEYGLLLDVDFIPSIDAKADILQHLALQQQNKSKLEHSKQLFVLPAFQRHVDDAEGEVFPSELPRTKSELVRKLSEDSDTYTPFHEYFYPGHGPENHTKWMETKSLYEVKYIRQFEPYVVIRLQGQQKIVCFWENFLGYGFNKYSWLEELACDGYSFHVLPNSFLVHLDHAHEFDRMMSSHNVLEYYDNFQPYLREMYEFTFLSEEEAQERREWSLKYIRKRNDMSKK